MASTTLTAEADVATRRDSTLAAGLGDHLPVGYWSGAIYRSAIRFPIPAGWTGWASITKAVLNLYVTDHQHVGIRNSQFYVRRYGGTLWTKAAGTQDCESGFSAANNTQADDVAPVTNDQVQYNSGSTVNLKRAITVTTLVEWYWDHAQSKIVLILDPVSSSDYMEFWSREHGSLAPTLEIDYTTASVPTAPTLTDPDPLGEDVPEVRPTFHWTHHDPQDDPQTGADVEVYQGATLLTTLHPAVATDGFATSDIDLPRGVALSWRVRTYDAGGAGAWSSYGQFSILNNPVVTIDATRRMVFANGAPRLVVQWSSTQPQTSYRVQTASGYDSGIITSAATTHTLSTRTLTDNVAETITVTVVSTYGLTGAASRAFTPRYGLTSHRRDLITAPQSWVDVTVLSTVPADASLVIEYGSADTALAAPTGGWFSTLSAVPRRQFLYWRAWFIPSATAGPTLDKITFSTINVASLVDKWGTTRDTAGLVAPWSIDPGESVYGTRSLRADVQGAGPYYAYAYKVHLRAGRNYILTGLMKSNGNSGAQFQLQKPDGTVLVGGGMSLPAGPVQSPALVATTDWFDPQKRDTNRYRTPVYIAEADMDVYVALKVGGTAGSQAWFDAIKLEESTVATPWSPGAIGATVVDAGGVQIDGARGGVFRYRGSDNGARSVVAGGPSGLLFAGDTELTSPSDGALAVDGVGVSLAGHTHAAPATMLMGQAQGLSQAGITAQVDITGASLTFTAVAGHTYKVDFGGNGLSTVATDVLSLRLQEAAAVLAAVAWDVAAASRNNSGAGSYIASGLSAGAHTFKLVALRANGTGSFSVSGVFIIITDLG
jgi:hypothetical protein